MFKDYDDIKHQLDDEMNHIRFTESMKRKVLNRRKPSFWEREVCIPVVPIACTLLIIIAVGIGINVSIEKPKLSNTSPSYVTIGGAVFHESLLSTSTGGK